MKLYKAEIHKLVGTVADNSDYLCDHFPPAEDGDNILDVLEKCFAGDALAGIAAPEAAEQCLLGHLSGNALGARDEWAGRVITFFQARAAMRKVIETYWESHFGCIDSCYKLDTELGTNCHVSFLSRTEGYADPAKSRKLTPGIGKKHMAEVDIKLAIAWAKEPHVAKLEPLGEPETDPEKAYMKIWEEFKLSKSSYIHPYTYPVLKMIEFGMTPSSHRTHASYGIREEEVAAAKEWGKKIFNAMPSTEPALTPKQCFTKFKNTYMGGNDAYAKDQILAYTQTGEVEPHKHLKVTIPDSSPVSPEEFKKAFGYLVKYVLVNKEELDSKAKAEVFAAIDGYITPMSSWQGMSGEEVFKQAVRWFRTKTGALTPANWLKFALHVGLTTKTISRAWVALYDEMTQADQEEEAGIAQSAPPPHSLPEQEGWETVYKDMAPGGNPLVAEKQATKAKKKPKPEPETPWWHEAIKYEMPSVEDDVEVDNPYAGSGKIDHSGGDPWGLKPGLDVLQECADFYILVLAGALEIDTEGMLEQKTAFLADQFRRYTDMVIGGEARHGRVRLYKGRGKIPQAFYELISTGTLPGERSAAWKVWHHFRQTHGTVAVRWMSEYYGIRDIWPGGYGGLKWKNIADTLVLYEDGLIGDLVFVDTCFALEHNGGCYFDKSAFFDTWKLQAKVEAGPWQGATGTLKFMLDAKQRGGLRHKNKTRRDRYEGTVLVEAGYQLLYDNASEPVRRLYDAKVKQHLTEG